MDTPEDLGNYLSYTLLHRPDSILLHIDDEGWTSIEQLIAAAEKNGRTLEKSAIEAIVVADPGQRFAISADRQRIRAASGRAQQGGPSPPAESPPDYLYYPSTTRLLGPIHGNGLRSRSTHMLHLFDDAETANSLASAVAERVVITVQASSMHERGFAFWRGENGVWLTELVPPEFLL